MEQTPKLRKTKNGGKILDLGGIQNGMKKSLAIQHRSHLTDSLWEVDLEQKTPDKTDGRRLGLV